MLTIGESRLISEANERERQAREHSIQQAAEKRHCSKNGDLKLSSNHTVAKFVFFSNFFLSSFFVTFFPFGLFPFIFTADPLQFRKIFAILNVFLVYNRNLYKHGI